jgi:predicted unusual protein kinase regulating ubiquinone biosynthesis (AarF/ABC1/UbiB family)
VGEFTFPGRHHAMRRRSTLLLTALVGAVGGAIGVIWRRRRRSAGAPTAIDLASRASRNVTVAGLAARVGTSYASTAARKAFASAERRTELDRQHELRTATDIADTLGQMKGALMKIGQMAAYLDEGLPEPLRVALAQLQAQAPPMAPELAAGVILSELGAPPEALFVEWDPVPIAAASIGQVHRALWRDPATGHERAVAVKVQYPGVDEAIASDLANTDLLGTLFAQVFRGLDPAPMVAEIRARISEELDYRIEATNQRLFAEHYRGHPYARVPAVIDALSTQRVLTTELATGMTWAELLQQDQHTRDQAAETIFRFVFRSLYRFRAFNGDPHPGNYLFGRDGTVTFLDFGLVKYFSADEMDTFMAMISSAVLEHDWARFRSIVELAGLLRADAPVETDTVGEYFSHFYDAVREDREVTWSPEYASATVRRTFDRNSPIAQYATVPSSFVIIQRINLGLYAILGQLRARGNYRRIAEEIWPMTSSAPSTPIGEAEAAWLTSTR